MTEEIVILRVKKKLANIKIAKINPYTFEFAIKLKIV